MRNTAAGSQQSATDAIVTSTASGDVPFATGDVTDTGVTSTAIAIVVSAGAKAAVASDKQNTRR